MDITLNRVKVIYDLGTLSTIPRGEGRVFQVGETRVAVFRTRDDEVFATQADCPHRSGPLADGIVGDGKVICPLHAAAFDLATGAPMTQTCAMALKTYPVSVDFNGHMIMTLAE
jgi:nitrite reductase (NADH) small subunit